MTEQLVADTSLIINFFNGHPSAITYIEGRDIWLSGITEIELLSSPKLSVADQKIIKDFIKRSLVIDLVPQVKEIATSLRRQYKLKLSDAVIAATAIYLGIPLYTYDSDFRKISEITDIVILER